MSSRLGSSCEGLLDREAYDEAHASPIDEPEWEKQDAEPVPVAA
ncbi:hypothetical protein ACFQ8O_11915 [Streptomyces coelicoflavus]